ncbi:tetratricopeptide repeat-containing sensor histidine kinase [Lentimicrobium sp. S6]|uniref:tetratricopeptide repeat-containing sensor histidine kinase n=1 Tax=Lentimicrobium sp. S6 TaxID=2735872 RepID=UPI001552BA72|nr:tetratricopeptide repeat-containing sensor histidine kinase [Lentimicrobium sp. S6]NPD44955.1 tetratricopeptide repeat-containing sensor histidine kinase [Lentimicrobium sp. S6]
MKKSNHNYISISKNIIFLFTLLTFSLSYNCLYSQNKSEALEQKYKALQQYLKNNELEKLFHFANELKSDAKAQSSPKYLAHSNYYLGIYYQNINKLDSSNIFLSESIGFYKELKDSLNIGKTYFFLGINNTYLGETETSLENYSSSDYWLRKTQDSAWISVVNNYMSITYFEIGNYPQSLKYLQVSLDYLQGSDNFMSIGGNYNTMGNIYRKMKEPYKEEQAYLNAIRFLEQIPENHQLGMTYNNLAEVYLNDKKTDLGFEYLEKAKACYQSIEYELGMCSYYSVLSLFYLMHDKPDYNKVIEYSSKSIKIAEKHNDYRQFSDASYFLGQAFYYQKNYSSAQKVLEKGYLKAKNHSFTNELKNITQVLSQVYEAQNNLSKSLFYIKEYNELKDSLFNQEKIIEFTSLDLNYKFKQEQLEDSLNNAIEKTKIQFKHDAEIKTHSMIRNYSLGISILLISFAIFLLYSIRKKKRLNNRLHRQNQTIKKQKTELELTSLQIKQALEDLQELDDFKQTFINMLVHDLKNPLNALTNIEGFESEELRLEIVKRTSQDMLNLVLNLLDINKAKHQKINLHKEDISLVKLINQAIDDTHFLWEQKQIRIKLDYNKEYRISADYSMLLRILINLLTNAIKASCSEDYIKITISESELNQLQLSIKDNGPGINIDDKEIIFEKYKQINQKKSDKTHSTGLGLAFCKVAVQAHGWNIGLHSVEGLGAQFWIRIPNYKTKMINKHPQINQQQKEYDNSSLFISKEDLEKVIPYLYQLEKLQVYAVSDVKNIINTINALGIDELQDWTQQVLSSVSNYDENKYMFLIHSILK